MGNTGILKLYFCINIILKPGIKIAVFICLQIAVFIYLQIGASRYRASCFLIALILIKVVTGNFMDTVDTLFLCVI